MPPLRNKNRIIIAVCASDLHLCLTPPVYRSLEEEWLATQTGYLLELAELSIGPNGYVPIIYPGDIFHYWYGAKGTGASELLNWVIDSMPKGYAIPGQHDLPCHQYKDIKRSAYWTLVEAGVLANLEPGKFTEVVPNSDASCTLRLHAFPWGFEVQENKNPHSLVLDVCVSHSFIWTKNTGYPGAPPQQRLKQYKRRLRGYDIALFGDNHRHVSWNLDRRCPDRPAIFNPGSFYRRTTDQADHQPCVGLVYSDGTVGVHALDVSADKYLTPDAYKNLKVNGKPAADFIGNLLKISDVSVNFEAEINKKLSVLPDNKEGRLIRQVVLSALEGEGKL